MGVFRVPKKHAFWCIDDKAIWLTPRPKKTQKWPKSGHFDETGKIGFWRSFKHLGPKNMKKHQKHDKNHYFLGKNGVPTTFQYTPIGSSEQPVAKKYKNDQKQQKSWKTTKIIILPKTVIFIKWGISTNATHQKHHFWPLLDHPEIEGKNDYFGPCCLRYRLIENTKTINFCQKHDFC